MTLELKVRYKVIEVCGITGGISYIKFPYTFISIYLYTIGNYATG